MPWDMPAQTITYSMHSGEVDKSGYCCMYMSLFYCLLGEAPESTGIV